MEFHISRRSRDRYQFDQSLFTLSGNVIFANFYAVRLFVQKVNQKQNLVLFPEKAWKAGQVNAMGLIDEILHYVIYLYRQEKNSQAIVQALDWLDGRFGPGEVDKAILNFCEEFPPLAVYRGEISISDYLNGSTDGIPNRAVAFEEMIMLWVTSKNPAVVPYSELFDDKNLEKSTKYSKIFQETHAFFETQPKFGPDNQNLLDMLRAPALAVPGSLSGQLEYIKARWSGLLGRFLLRLLSSLDLIKEEQKNPFLGTGVIPIPTYGPGAEFEPERFSQDKDWMPRLVMIAKNTYVWMDQLRKKYQLPIYRLDQIPDEELDRLAHWGFTGLWLIGLWERSEASARIKQLCGNPEAISSAYSLADYRIAGDLGGEDSYNNLRNRAWQRGIRMTSDMVPNHMGIDSRWVIDHPDWFISLSYSPFPSYSFNGPNLSPDSRVGIYLEDHYYSRSDAAVVFKWVNHQNGDTRYMYHGNDGTSMPWNDTAQLNYLNPDVREAVIQTILSVARRFPVIRFDAAMTLAKKHYQRLWFPEPGSGGAIPSRSEQSMTRGQFDAAFPVEFWREVVDRVAQEVPDTLLLAEAFWLMEGYFVRTLGMHRVYNSAFMNMLRNEDNAQYRLVMKNTLEFDPEIMKRFVNFMNNPDERTAIDQFGKGDKYFGICTMMATIPGLPMFGHGQIEGYSEKYGMEFRRAYWDEMPDQYLVERHEREIFPLLHRRYLFAGVENFLLYDFYTTDGQVNEDVFAYSNRVGSERGLVVYHNKFSSTAGWIRTSVGFSVKTGTGDQRQIVQRTLAEGLGLNNDPAEFVVFYDHHSGLEYIRPSTEIFNNGLYLQLDAYKYHVFLDFRLIKDDNRGSYRHLYDYLNGKGVPNIQNALTELLLQPIHHPFKEICNTGYMNYLLSARLTEPDKTLPQGLLDEAVYKMSGLLMGIENLTGQSNDWDLILTKLRQELSTVLSLEITEKIFPKQGNRKLQQALEVIKSGLKDRNDRWLILYNWLFTHNLGRLATPQNFEIQSVSWLSEWQLTSIIAGTMQLFGIDDQTAWRIPNTVRLLIGQQSWYESIKGKTTRQILENWLADEAIQNSIGVNRYQDQLWFNKEAFEEFLWWMNVLVVIQFGNDEVRPQAKSIESILKTREMINELVKAEQASEYKLDKLLEATAG